MKRNLERMRRAKEVISYGKLSGAVGTFANIDPFVEKYALKIRLKARACCNAGRAEDRHAEFFTTLALIAATIEKIAIEIRHLQRTEVLEVEEPFTIGQRVLRQCRIREIRFFLKILRALPAYAGIRNVGNGKRRFCGTSAT